MSLQKRTERSFHSHLEQVSDDTTRPSPIKIFTAPTAGVASQQKENRKQKSEHQFSFTCALAYLKFFKNHISHPPNHKTNVLPFLLFDFFVRPSASELCKPSHADPINIFLKKILI